MKITTASPADLFNAAKALQAVIDQYKASLDLAKETGNKESQFFWNARINEFQESQKNINQLIIEQIT